MKGNDKVVSQLNELLAGELAARDQYFVHSRMYQDFGLSKLYERMSHESEEETEHARLILERILFLEGTPDLSRHPPLHIGQDVPQMLANDLDFELLVVSNLRKAIAICEKEGDYQTREILAKLLADTEEDHTHWLEQQLGLLEKIGLKNYLQSQM